MSFLEPGLVDMIMRLRSRGISDTSVLRAMEAIPRTVFVPNALKMQSYDECEIPIACGQSLLAPLTVAILCQTLQIAPNHKVLHIGTGSGYSVAVLSKLCTRVYSVERYKTLRDEAEERLRNLCRNTVLRHGDGRFGWRGQAPFDRIMVCGSVRVMPTALLEQLPPRGRMVAVVDGKLCVAERTGGRIKETTVMDMQLPALVPGKSLAL
ncbi:MAG: protein-L-isoaspartate(D-aspartate) O-methyltransferase [Robiginitomaculum sp.]|nr:MAG: protein-L-isoaspartate(D-aspartate) O-methyltransferase [Robiginitomaculum sp.]